MLNEGVRSTIGAVAPDHQNQHESQKSSTAKQDQNVIHSADIMVSAKIGSRRLAKIKEELKQRKLKNESGRVTNISMLDIQSSQLSPIH